MVTVEPLALTFKLEDLIAKAAVFVVSLSPPSFVVTVLVIVAVVAPSAVVVAAAKVTAETAEAVSVTLKFWVLTPVI
jgi:hypothetical protein